jgi:hypothetical protein
MSGSDSTTPNFGLTLPAVGGSQDSWGNKTNANWTLVDGILLPLITGNISGPLTASGNITSMGGYISGVGGVLAGAHGVAYTTYGGLTAFAFIWDGARVGVVINGVNVGWLHPAAT